MEQEFDIKQVFEQTKKSIESSIIANNGKLDFLNELITYFELNKLKVVQEVSDTSDKTEIKK